MTADASEHSTRQLGLHHAESPGEITCWYQEKTSTLRGRKTRTGLHSMIIAELRGPKHGSLLCCSRQRCSFFGNSQLQGSTGSTTARTHYNGCNGGSRGPEVVPETSVDLLELTLRL